MTADQHNDMAEIEARVGAATKGHWKISDTFGTLKNKTCHWSRSIAVTGNVQHQTQLDIL